MCKSHQIQTCYHSRNTASQGKITGKNSNYSIASMLVLEGLSASLRYMAVCLSIGESVGKEILEGHMFSFHDRAAGRLFHALAGSSPHGWDMWAHSLVRRRCHPEDKAHASAKGWDYPIDTVESIDTYGTDMHLLILMVRTSSEDFKSWWKMLTSSNRWWQLDIVKFRQKSLDPILPDAGIPERLKAAWELEDGLNSKHSRCKMLFQKIPEARAHIQTKDEREKVHPPMVILTHNCENPTSKMNWWRF